MVFIGLWDEYFKINQNIVSGAARRRLMFGGFEISRAGTYPKYLAETVLSLAYTTRNTAIFVCQILEIYHPRV